MKQQLLGAPFGQLRRQVEEEVSGNILWMSCVLL